MTTTNTPYGAGAMCYLPATPERIRDTMYSMADAYGQYSAPVIREFLRMVMVTSVEDLGTMLHNMNGYIERDKATGNFQEDRAALIRDLLEAQHAGVEYDGHTDSFKKSISLITREVMGAVMPLTPQAPRALVRIEATPRTGFAVVETSVMRLRRQAEELAAQAQSNVPRVVESDVPFDRSRPSAQRFSMFLNAPLVPEA